MENAALDEIDERIIETLEHDGRISMRQLAARVHVSRANIYARVERLRSAGVITGFTAVVDPEARGFATSAFLTVNLRQAEWREVRKRLAEVPGVEHIALVGGDFDAVLLVRARDNTDLRRLVLDDIQSIPGVVSTRTLLIFDESNPHRDWSAS